MSDRWSRSFKASMLMCGDVPASVAVADATGAERPMHMLIDDWGMSITFDSKGFAQLLVDTPQSPEKFNAALVWLKLLNKD